MKLAERLPTDGTVKRAFEETQLAFAELQAVQVTFREELNRLKQGDGNGQKFGEVQQKWDIAFEKFQLAQQKFADALHAIDQPKSKPT
jgi:hypothetical protein